MNLLLRRFGRGGTRYEARVPPSTAVMWPVTMVGDGGGQVERGADQLVGLAHAADRASAVGAPRWLYITYAP
jgi:hypothetical protein